MLEIKKDSILEACEFLVSNFDSPILSYSEVLWGAVFIDHFIHRHTDYYYHKKDCHIGVI